MASQLLSSFDLHSGEFVVAVLLQQQRDAASCLREFGVPETEIDELIGCATEPTDAIFFFPDEDSAFVIAPFQGHLYTWKALWDNDYFFDSPEKGLGVAQELWVALNRPCAIFQFRTAESSSVPDHTEVHTRH
jgi:hypothetical protein